MRYYFDPVAAAGLMTRIDVTPKMSLGLTLSYSFLFEKENTGRMVTHRWVLCTKFSNTFLAE